LTLPLRVISYRQSLMVRINFRAGFFTKADSPGGDLA
jgi:hypothetical protein